MVKWANRPSSLRVSISVWYSALWLVMHWWVYAVAECDSNELSLLFSTTGIVIEVARWGLERRMSGLSALLSS